MLPLHLDRRFCKREELRYGYSLLIYFHLSVVHDLWCRNSTRLIYLFINFRGRERERAREGGRGIEIGAERERERERERDACAIETVGC